MAEYRRSILRVVPFVLEDAFVPARMSPGGCCWWCCWCTCSVSTTNERELSQAQADVGATAPQQKATQSTRQTPLSLFGDAASCENLSSSLARSNTAARSQSYPAPQPSPTIWTSTPTSFHHSHGARSFISTPRSQSAVQPCSIPE